MTVVMEEAALNLFAKIAPPLWERHRGFSLLVWGIVIMHSCSALDSLLPGTFARHDYPIWQIHNTLAPEPVWGVAHLITACVMTYGVYTDKANLRWVRLGCAFSLFVYSLLCFSFFVSFVLAWPAASLVGTGFTLFALLGAVAALLEPDVNPASHKGNHVDRCC